MSTWFSDLRPVLRALWRSPGFTLSAILTLALGLAGALALATVVHGVILRPLPYLEPHRLAAVTVQDKDGRMDDLSPTDVPDLMADSKVCQELLLFAEGRALELELGDRFGLASTMEVDGNLLENLGARPALGRLFLSGDAKDSVLLSQEAWQRLLGGDPGVAGRTIQLDGKPRLVLGVVAKGFQLPGMAKVPDAYTILDRKDANRGGYSARGVARLRPGATLDQLNADFRSRSSSMAQAFPETNQNIVYQAEDLQTYLLGDRAKSLLLALGLAGLLLLLACVNVAHLFLTHSLERRQELALRCALGATGRGLLLHHLAEGMAVGLPAALLGLGGAWMALKLLPIFLPHQEPLRPDVWEVLLALLLVLATSLAFALLPLRQSRDPRLEADLRSGSRSSTTSSRHLRAGLVIAESALAVVMLAMGGLFMTSFLKALHRDPGYQLREGVAFSLSLPKRRYPTPEAPGAFHAALQARLEALPGVRGVVFSSGLPNGRGINRTTCVHSFPTNELMSDWPLVAMVGTAPGYFTQMGIPFLQGRDLQLSDHTGAPPVAILSAQAARQLFPGRSPLGQRIQTGMGTSSSPEGMAFEVVGICGDVVQGDVRERSSPHCYFSLAQASWRSCEVALSTSLNPEALRPHIEAEVKALDPRISVQELHSLKALNLKRLADLQQATWLLGLFAGLGLFLGIVGVASVVSTQVARRTKEIGLRMALGASPGQILHAILGRTVTLVFAGALGGAVLAAMLGRIVAARLYQTPPTDPWILTGAIFAFSAVAGLAGLVPSLRAAKMDPSMALRSE